MECMDFKNEKESIFYNIKNFKNIQLNIRQEINSVSDEVNIFKFQDIRNLLDYIF